MPQPPWRFSTFSAWMARRPAKTSMSFMLAVMVMLVCWNCGFCGIGIGDGERAWEEGFIYFFNFA
jgi:hypothetical protein